MQINIFLQTHYDFDKNVRTSKWLRQIDMFCIHFMWVNGTTQTNMLKVVSWLVDSYIFTWTQPWLELLWETLFSLLFGMSARGLHPMVFFFIFQFSFSWNGVVELYEPKTPKKHIYCEHTSPLPIFYLFWTCNFTIFEPFCTISKHCVKFFNMSSFAFPKWILIA